MLSCGHTLQKIFRIVICSKLTVCFLLALQLDRLLQKDRLSQILHDLPYLKELKRASHVVGRKINRKMLSASQCALEKLQGSVSLGCSAPWQAVLKSSTSPWGKKKKATNVFNFFYVPFQVFCSQRIFFLLLRNFVLEIKLTDFPCSGNSCFSTF